MVVGRGQSGFSLIELLVVFMVMSLILALVGPSAGKVYAQYSAQQEVRLFRQYVKNAALYAFVHHANVGLSLAGNHFLVQEHPVDPEDNQENLDQQVSSAIFEHRFEYIRFPEMSFLALQSGYVTIKKIPYSVELSGVEREAQVRGIAYSEIWQEM